MRVWKLQASSSADWLSSIWGYAIAADEMEALAICYEFSGKPFNQVHAKHPEMCWPGQPGEYVTWQHPSR